MVNTATAAPDVIVAAGGLVSSQAMVAAITSRSLTRRLVFASGRVRADEPRREHPPYAGQGMYLETTKQRPEDIETRQRMSEFFAPSKIFHLVNDQSVVGDDESRWEIQKLVARDAATIQSAITDGRSKGAQAIVVSADPCFTENRRTVARCIDGRLPAGSRKMVGCSSSHNVSQRRRCACEPEG